MIYTRRNTYRLIAVITGIIMLFVLLLNMYTHAEELEEPVPETSVSEEVPDDPSNTEDLDAPPIDSPSTDDPLVSTPEVLTSEPDTSVDPVLTYSAHMQTHGWLDEVCQDEISGLPSGNKRLEAFKISVSTDRDIHISYSARVDNVWQSPVSDGDISGTIGLSKPIDGIRMYLTGSDASSYSLWYSVYVYDVGWTAYVRDGSNIGDRKGDTNRIEAFRAIILPRNSTPLGTIGAQQFGGAGSSVTFEENLGRADVTIIKTLLTSNADSFQGNSNWSLRANEGRYDKVFNSGPNTVVTYNGTLAPGTSMNLGEFSLTWKNAAMTRDGVFHDITLTFSDFIVRNPGTTTVPANGFVSVGDSRSFLWINAYAFDSAGNYIRIGVNNKVTVSFSDLSTEKYIFQCKDLDQRGINETGTSTGFLSRYTESVQILEGFNTPIYVLDPGDNVKYIDISSNNTLYRASDTLASGTGSKTEKYSGFATLADSDSSFRWSGTQCGTALLFSGNDFGPYKLICTTSGKYPDNVYISPSDENVPWHDTRTVEMIPDENFWISQITVDEEIIDSSGISEYIFGPFESDHKIDVQVETAGLSLCILKSDADNPNNMLSGAVYRLTGYLSNGSFYDQELTTDESGQLLFGGLTKGQYELREISPPENYLSDPENYIIDIDESGSVTVKGTDGNTPEVSENTIYLTDVKGTGSLIIDKEVTGNISSKTKEFCFKLALSEDTIPYTEQLTYRLNDEKVGTLSGEYTFSLKHGDKITISGIPLGLSYEVVETDSKGYTSTSQNNTGIVTADNEEISFLNTRNALISTGISTPGFSLAVLALLSIITLGLFYYVFLVRKRKRLQR